MSSVFFVTGSSRGLGRHIVEQALAAGHRVVATARDPRTLDDLAARYGDRVHVEQLDVTDPDAAAAAVRNGAAVMGRIDVVVNNAGQADRVSVEDTTLDAFRRQIETNLLGTVYVSKAAVPLLREQGGGRIIQISSVGGRVASPGLSAYQAAKWAVGGFSEVLAAEVAPLGIKVTVVEPGGMPTDWAGSSMTTPEISPPYRATVGASAAAAAERIPTSDPRKVADLVLTIAELDEPPLRILAGSDAYEFGRQAWRHRIDTDAKWEHLSRSTDADNAGDDWRHHVGSTVRFRD